MTAPGPLLTRELQDSLRAARDSGATRLECSLDLGRTRTVVELSADGWRWQGAGYPDLEDARDRTVYHWDGAAFRPVARYGSALVKLVPTAWGPPTFEIDGVKMLPTAQVSPWEDARRKVALVEPRGRTVLDCCAGLGYFAAACLEADAARVLSFEKNPDVLWLRSLNPWSPADDVRLELVPGDVFERIRGLEDGSIDAVLHDPPRFALAGELYSREFYGQLARVLRRGGRMFHYTGAPNRLSRGRDLPREVVQRLRTAGFRAAPHGDGVLAIRG
jgi:predicted methyltransferase